MNTIIIIPAYNEEQNILKLIKLIKKKIKANIIIVDDSSNNKTKELVARIGNHIFYA